MASRGRANCVTAASERPTSSIIQYQTRFTGRIRSSAISPARILAEEHVVDADSEACIHQHGDDGVSDHLRLGNTGDLVNPAIRGAPEEDRAKEEKQIPPNGGQILEAVGQRVEQLEL